MASLITAQGVIAVTASEAVRVLGGGNKLVLVNDGPLDVNIEIDDSETATVTFSALLNFPMKSGEAEVLDIRKGHSMAVIASGAGPTSFRFRCYDSGLRS